MNKTFIFAYTVLVVLPLLGLVAILNYGRRLAAPLSVDGVWNFEASPDGLAGLLCVKADVPIQGALTISQSGKALVLRMGDAPQIGAIGSIEGNTITASVLPLMGPQRAGCGNGRLLTLSAAVAAHVHPRSLVGALNAKDCAACPSVKFHAVRQVNATTQKDH
jgi:hypothetical protein